jgi:hypothetical protein
MFKVRQFVCAHRNMEQTMPLPNEECQHIQKPASRRRPAGPHLPTGRVCINPFLISRRLRHPVKHLTPHTDILRIHSSRLTQPQHHISGVCVCSAQKRMLCFVCTSLYLTQAPTRCLALFFGVKITGAGCCKGRCRTRTL